MELDIVKTVWMHCFYTPCSGQEKAALTERLQSPYGVNSLSFLSEVSRIPETFDLNVPVWLCYLLVWTEH
jgi:hypothetical protein